VFFARTFKAILMICRWLMLTYICKISYTIARAILEVSERIRRRLLSIK